MALDAAFVIAELRRRLPRLLFATYDHFPLAGGLAQGHSLATGPLHILAVRSLPVEERLDAPVAIALKTLVSGEPHQMVAKSLEFDIPATAGPATNFHVVVNWHDALDFISLLLRGNASCVEALRSVASDAVAGPPLFVDDDFSSLIDSITSTRTPALASFNALSSSKGYLMACAGPAMSIARSARKKKESQVADGQLRDNSVLAGLCRRVAVCAEPELLARVDKFVDNGELSKAPWLVLVQELMETASKAASTQSVLSAAPLEKWIDELREREFAAFVEKVCSPAAAQTPSVGPKIELDTEWQDRLAAMWPIGAELVFMAQTGSFMYNLQVASSDCDFSVIFMSRPGDLCKRELLPSEFQKHVAAGFGADKRGEIEYSGKELGNFVVELAKGNPRNIELLYTDKPCTVGSVWQELKDMRRSFLTLRCADQYLGFISDRLKKAQALCDESLKEQSFPESSGIKISKLFYHAHHKMFELARVLEGREPCVALVAEERDFVLRLRGQPPLLLSEAQSGVLAIKERWSELRDQFEKVKSQKLLPCEVDVDVLTTWLLSVRTHQIMANRSPGSGGYSSGPNAMPPPSSPPALMRHRTQSDTEAIAAMLENLEADENIRIIHAGYGPSSRTLGTMHGESDHDVKFIFALQRTKYLGLQQPATALKRTFPAGGGLNQVDISGWEARHACRMLADGNPSVLHVLHSPVIFKTTPWADELRSLANKVLNRPKLAMAWGKHGRDNYREYITDKATPIRKKYVHVLRPLLCLAWLRRHCSREPPAEASAAWPPADLMEMAQQVALDGGLTETELDTIAVLVSHRDFLPCALPHESPLEAIIERLLQEETSSVPPYEAIGAREDREKGWHELCGAMIDAMSSF